MLNLCIPTLNSFDTLETAIAAAMSGTLIPDRIIIVDNSNGLCPIKGNTKIHIHVPQFNLGVAGSWNWFMNNYSEDMNILINDDIIVHKDTIKNFVDGVGTQMLRSDTKGGIYFAAEGANAFSFFYLNNEIYQEVGEFDEAFYPAYFEDNDYHMRLKQKGYTLQSIAHVACDHVGSSTLKHYTEQQMEQHHRNFRRNQEYYITKWGGLPGQETRS